MMAIGPDAVCRSDDNPGVAYDPTIIAAIKQRAAQVKNPKARDRYTRAALQTGIVESGLQNLPGGDSDSVNWRQERSSIYGGDMSVTRSVDRFFNEAAQLDRGQPSWQLAADVQRPAAQYRGRYKDVAKQAASLLGGSPSPSTGNTTVAAAGPSGSGQPAAPGLTDPGTTGDFTGLLGQLLAKPDPVVQQTPVAPPSFSARAPLPQGFQAPTPEAQMAPAQADPVGGALSLLETLRGTDPASAAPGPGDAAGGPQETVVTSVMKQRAAAKQAGTASWPVAGTGKVIGTPYAGTHTLGNWQSDNAIDIGVPIGTPMVALQDGVVVKVTKHPQGSGRFAGDQITIRGANGNEYFYGHGVAGVKAGQKVAKGQELGTTGSANGVAHLHFGQLKGDPRKHAVVTRR